MQLRLIAPLFLAASVLRADMPVVLTPTIVITAPATAPTSFKDSQAQVTPDPKFTVQGYADRWPHVNLDEAKRLHARKDVVFVDGRNYSEWETSHIPGAISLPVGEFDKRYDDAKTKKKLKKAHVIVAYCHGENCRLADHLAQQLVGKGHKNVAVYYGGFPGWSGAGLPLEDKDGKPYKTPTPVVQAPPQPQPGAVPHP